MGEIIRFRHNHQMFDYYNCENELPNFPIIHIDPKSKYQLEGMSFDIETTSFEKDGEHFGTMYHWQFGIGRNTYTGRTWSSCMRFFESLNKKAEAMDATFLIYVQNFPFEWQWIKGWLKWNDKKDRKTGLSHKDIFSKSNRDVIYAKSGRLEFRDSMILTQSPLRSYKKNFNLSIGKLEGDLDYSIKRHYASPMTPAEIAYCINDVQVLTEWYETYIVPNFLKKGKHIPLTMTGIPRSDLNEEFASLTKEYKKEYISFINSAMPTKEQYQIQRQFLFRGGLTHANTSRCNSLIEEDSAGDDLKSAHPAAMLEENFSKKFYRMNKEAFFDILEECRDFTYCFYGSFRFYNIRAKGWHCLESKNKLVDYSEDAVFENGRLAFASYIEVVLHSIDWFNYEMMYEWDDVVCDYIYESEMGPLPDFIRKMCLKYFELKETIPKETLEYMLAKRKLNSLFGMMATGIVERDVIFNEETNEFEYSDYEKDYYEQIRNSKMLPMWAIETAAYSRRKICMALSSMGVDAIYYDTDSVKYLNPEKHRPWIEKFNEERIRINKTMELYGHDPKHVERIGCFENEFPHIDRLKVLGAKRYLLEADGKLLVTVAGMKKGSLEAYCKNHNFDIWDTFSNKLKLPAGESWKQTTSYCDHEFSFDFEDDFGNITKIYEKSSVAIFEIPFEMSMEKEFLNRIQIKTEERENQFYKGVL